MATICRTHKLLFIMVPGMGCSATGKILQEQFGGEWIPRKDIYENNSLKLGKKHNSISELVKANLISRRELPIYLKFGTVRNPFDTFTTKYARAISDEWINRQTIGRIKKLTDNEKEEGTAYLTKVKNKLKKKQQKLVDMGFENWLENYLHSYQLKRRANLLERFKDDFKKNFVYSINYVPTIYSPLLRGVDQVIRLEYLESDFNTLLKEAGVISHNEWVSIPQTNPTKGKKAYQEYYTQRTRSLVEKCLAKELAIFDYQFE
ncbi:MAG: sulfotransferase family 2 domain-containing protein [Crocosphaera sp.]